jgi:hypothetical protein
MKRSKFKKSRAFAAATLMPPCQHKPNPEFDIFASEVVGWLIKKPEILHYIFDRLSRTGAIIFDPETQTWRGRDFSRML